MTEEKKMLFSQDALRKLLWPLIIEQFLAIAMGMADTVMAASCGEAVVRSWQHNTWDTEIRKW